jgi:hypothetical protein
MHYDRGLKFMRRKKGLPVIELTQQQRDELNQFTRKRSTAYFYAKRAKVILELDEGKSISEAGRVVEMERRHIYKWVDRYKEFGLKGLSDLQRPGRPKSNPSTHSSLVVTAPLNIGCLNGNEVH